jgi:predicted ATPase/transcriptional regulator with XRE-family HTH domain
VVPAVRYNRGYTKGALVDEIFSFGAWVKQRRLLLRLRRDELAQRVHCSTELIRKIELDARRPSVAVAEQLAIQLRLPAHQQALFVRVARAELPVSQLSVPAQHLELRPPLASLPFPHPLTPLVGRVAEVAAVRARVLMRGVRLVTLLGAPGIGKTRLALALAAELRSDFTDGVAFASLVSIRDPSLVTRTVAQALGVTETPGLPLIERLTRELHQRHLLLVMDNFEHVLAAAPVVSTLLTAAPQLTVLVTSRVPLHLYGEHVFSVPPLTLPNTARLPTPEILAQCPSVALFVSAAQAVQFDFRLTAANAADVAAICARLDGLPLAIELAAARTRLFSPQAVLARLTDRFALLTGGARDVPAHQQTLRSTFDWSYDLLSDDLRVLLRRFAVFAGGATAEAVERICTSDTGALLATMDRLTALIERGLLCGAAGLDDQPRFSMLESIREYAWERLQGSGEAEAIQQQYADHFLAWAETIAPDLFGTAQEYWLGQLDAEYANLHAALDWYRASGDAFCGLRLSIALGRFWYVRGMFDEGCNWLGAFLALGDEVPVLLRGQALSLMGEYAAHQRSQREAQTYYEASVALLRDAGDDRQLAQALAGLAWLMLDAGDVHVATAYADESIRLLQASGPTWDLAFALFTHSYLLYQQGASAEAQRRAEESMALFEALGDTWNCAGPRTVLGLLALERGDVTSARAYHEDSLRRWQVTEDTNGIEWALRNLGDVLCAQEEYEQAMNRYMESLQLAHRSTNRAAIVSCLTSLAMLVYRQGQPLLAARLLGAAEQQREALGVVIYPRERAAYNAIVTGLQTVLGAQTVARMWEIGPALSVEQAVNEVWCMRQERDWRTAGTEKQHD